MKICPKIFTDLNFEPAGIQPCCDIRALRVPSFPYNGGPVDLRAYATHMQNVLRELQTDTTLCKGCPDLQEIDRDGFSHEVSFRTISINMHRFFCNCKCVYCNLWNQPQKGIGYDILPAIKSLHEQNALQDQCYVSWGGGEPSILPTFNKAAEYVMANGYKQYVHTNAIRFSPVLADLLRHNMGGMNISLDSGSRDVYKKVKGVDAFDKVMENLERYCKEGNNRVIALKYIVFELNNHVPEIESFLNLCQRLDVGQIQYSLNFKEVNSNSVSQKTLLGAAFLRARAEQMNPSCTPVFLDEPWHGKIDALARELAGQDKQ